MQFDFKYEKKVIFALLVDDEFFDKSINICKLEYFRDEINQKIIGCLVRFYLKYSKRITLEALEDELLKDYEVDQVELIFESISESEDDDIQYYKDRFLEFCKTQKILNSTQELISDIEEGVSADEAYQKFELSQTKVLEHTSDILKPPLDFLLDDFTDEKIHVPRIPTLLGAVGTGGLDDFLDGGLPKGDLGMIMQPTGTGKTIFLLNLAANAVQKGYNVVFFSLEIPEHQIIRRLYQFFLGRHKREIDSLTNEDLRAELKKMYNTEKFGRFFIKKVPYQTATIQDLDKFLDKLKKDVGYYPDLLLVDYLDIMASPYKDVQDWKQLKLMSQDLRTLGEVKQIAIWTASQVNRVGAGKKRIKGDDAGESFAKLNAVNFLVTANPTAVTDENIVTKEVDLYVAKSNYGKDHQAIRYALEFSKMRWSFLGQKGLQNAFK